MIVIIIICIVLSALFSSSETAFASVNKIRLKSMADQGDKRALKALHIAEHYEDSLTAILVGNNIVNIGASSLATVVFTQWVGSAGPAVSTVAMTIVPSGSLDRLAARIGSTTPIPVSIVSALEISWGRKYICLSKSTPT